MKLLVFLVLLGLGISTSAAPASCTGVNSQYQWTLPLAGGIYRLGFSVNVNVLSSGPNNNTLSFSNITTTGFNSTVPLTKICAAPIGSGIMSNPCFDWSKPYNLSVPDGMIELTATFNFPTTLPNGTAGRTDYSLGFYVGVVDEGSLSFFDGRMYENVNQCYNYSYHQDQVQLTMNECAAAVTPITPPANTPSCTKMTSTTQISTQGSNNKTIMFNYMVDNSNIIMVGNYTGPIDYQPLVFINDAEGCNEVYANTIYCGYPLIGNGYKIMLFLTDRRSSPTANAPVALINRVIIRGGQTYTSEGNPFNSTNTCQTYTSNYGNVNTTTSTTLCCTEFAQAPTTAPTPNTASPASTGSSQTNPVVMTTSIGPTGSVGSLNVATSLVVAAALFVAKILNLC